MRKMKLAFLGLVFIQNIEAQEVKNNKMINDSSVVKKSIMSSDSVHQLNQVVVSSKKPLYEIKIDRTVVNVDASPSNVGANVIEVLEKAPGVNVDKDGNISLKGKNAVLVMIDGRPSYLSPADLFNYLKSLPATSIDQIELMTNPPAKYDASGNAGVINIKTKKTKTMGFNGTYNSSVGQGVYNRNSNSLNMNYRKDKINIFSNMSYSNWAGFNKLIFLRKFTDSNNKTSAIFDQNSFDKNEEKNNINGKIGVDYSINNKTNVGIVVSGFVNPEATYNDNISLLKDGNYKIDSIVKSSNSDINTWNNISTNFYLQHKFDSLGKEISIDIDASKFSSNRKSVLINNTLNSDNSFRYSEELLGKFPIDIQIVSIKTDYTHPLKNKAKLELGAKSSYVVTTNEANFYNI